MTLEDFVVKYNGQRVADPTGFIGECVGLVNLYIEERFGFHKEWKNAIDWFGADPGQFDWVRNDPKNLAQIPARGDLMVWGPGAHGVGTLGHIDIVLAADQSGFTGFDQNWPVGAPAHSVRHDYLGIIGWGTPKFAVPPVVVIPPVVQPPVVIPPVQPPVVVPDLPAPGADPDTIEDRGHAAHEHVFFEPVVAVLQDLLVALVKAYRRLTGQNGG